MPCKVFGMDLPSGAIEGDLVERHAADLDDQVRPITTGGQRCLDVRVKGRHALAFLVRLVGLANRHAQLVRWLAQVDSTVAFPFDLEPELTSGPEVTFNLPPPA